MKRSVLLIIAVTCLTSCATIIGGTTQTLSVNSNVDGAEVYLDGTLLGQTPLAVEIPRDKGAVLTVQKAGHTPYKIAMNTKIATMFWVNIFSAGTFGSSTDYSTGAMYEYEPATYFASLRSRSASADQEKQWRKKEGVRAYVLLNNEALVSELATGGGEHVDALIQFLERPAKDESKLIAQWQNLYTKSDTASVFAEAIVAEL